MITRTLEDLLRRHAFFGGMSQEHLSLLTGCASNRNYRDGEYLFRQSDPAKEFYVVRQGKVSIEVVDPEKGRLPLQTVGFNDVVGWTWVVPPFVHRFDARAIGLTRVIALDGECLRGKLGEDTELGYELLRRFVAVIAERLEAARIQLLDLYEP